MLILNIFNSMISLRIKKMKTENHCYGNKLKEVKLQYFYIKLKKKGKSKMSSNLVQHE